MIRIAEILNVHWADYVRNCGHPIESHVFKAANQIMACRTPKLGTDVYRCPGCDKPHFVYHSCRNRFCPTCGQTETNRWAETTLSQLLDMKHHHCTFTLPALLRPVAKLNKKVFYNILFKASTDVTKSWFETRHDIVPGIISVLHTAGSALNHHPHIHMIVSGGGLRKNGEEPPSKVELFGEYLVDEKFLGRRFRWRFENLLIKAYDNGLLTSPMHAGRIEFLSWIKTLNDKSWVVSIKKPLKDLTDIVRYVGRYTRRACLSEYRITSFKDGMIGFNCKDYRNKKGKRPGTKTVTLNHMEFLDRLFQHAPETGFRMVRYYGAYSRMSEIPEEYRQQAHSRPEKQTWRELQIMKTGIDPLICRECGCQMQY